MRVGDIGLKASGNIEMALIDNMALVRRGSAEHSGLLSSLALYCLQVLDL